MTVDWTEDPAAFADPGWTSLVDADPEATVFHTPRFLKVYWEELGAGEGLEVASVQTGGKVVATAAFATDGDQLSWLGGFDVTDYMGPVGSPQYRRRAADELMAAVAARDDWRRADLAGLPEQGTWLKALAEGGRQARLPVRIELDGERLATAVGFRFRDRFFLYNSAYDHRLSKLSPGMVLAAELIREAIEEGRSTFDFLKGDLGYKYRFGAKPRRVCRLLLDRA